MQNLNGIYKQKIQREAIGCFYNLLRPTAERVGKIRENREKLGREGKTGRVRG